MKQHLIIGIAGGSGSGKTTLAENIARHFGNEVSVIRHDNYYKAQPNLSYEQRAQMNYDHPSAFDSELLLQHLDALKAGQAVDGPVYDYAQHDRSTETVRIESTDVIILEGILIFENADILKRLDMKIYVDTDADVRIVRRILRDVEQRGRSLESVISQYLATVKPMHEAFVEPSKKKADIIIPEGGKNPVAYGMIINRIETYLSE
ncbi:MAG: uridine kinase [Clostridia bacterium]|nr:uridine kinase [Clostridia bacterium]